MMDKIKPELVKEQKNKIWGLSGKQNENRTFIHRRHGHHASTIFFSALLVNQIH